MPGVKRRHEDTAGTSENVVQASRKSKKQYSSEDAQLARIYNELADDVQRLRLSAARELVKYVTADITSRHQRIDTAVGRLIKGVCSSRKAARLGFSIALSEILRVAFACNEIQIESVLQRIGDFTQVQGNVSGQERRDAFLGRQFALNAILQCGVFSKSEVTAEIARSFLDVVAQLSAERQWLRRECGAMLYEFLISLGPQPPSTIFHTAVRDVWEANSMWKTPEGVALWIQLLQVEGLKLPKHVWHKRYPLQRHDRLLLAKVMQEIPVDEDKSSANGSRQIAPSFAWSVLLSELISGQEHQQDFAGTWTALVSGGLLSTTSSNERKSLGLQVVGIAITTLPAWTFRHIFSSEVMRCILNHRSANNRFLFEASGAVLQQALARSKADPTVSVELVHSLLESGGIEFDRLSRTKTIETLLVQCDDAALSGLAGIFHQYMNKPLGAGDSARADAQKCMVADLMVNIVRSRKTAQSWITATEGESKLPGWLRSFLSTLVHASYSLESEAHENGLPSTAQPILRSRITSCLAHLLTISSDVAYQAARHVVDVLQRVKRHSPAGVTANRSVIEDALSRMNDRVWGLDGDEETHQVAQNSLKLLLAMTIIQAYNDDPDALSMLRDTVLAVDASALSHRSSLVLVDIVLGYLSRPSTAYKKLAEQVFTTFADSISSEALESMLEILSRKESLGGQQELFDDGGDADSVVVVEEDSDVDIVNGLVAHKGPTESNVTIDAMRSSQNESDTASSSTSNDDDDDGDDDDDDDDDEDDDDDDDHDSAAAESGPEDEDEEAAFDRKLAAALGGAALVEAEDGDGSDMDDEQMMQLEPHLAKVFKERKKRTNTKRDNKDARETVINFKSRVLDVLSILARNAYQNTAVLSMIVPLCQVIRCTSSKMLSEKAFSVLKQYFDTCSKNKATPNPGENEVLFAILADIHAEALLDAAKIHTSACSRSSLFICKVLVAGNVQTYKQVANMYAEMQTKWYTDPQARIQGSMFTEWTSWSITTRKHK